MGPSQRAGSSAQWLELNLESAWRRDPGRVMGAKIKNGSQRLCQSEREGDKEVRSQTDAQEPYKCWVLSKEPARLKQDQGMAFGLRSQQSSSQG